MISPRAILPTPLHRTRALILAYGRNATSYQIMNPGILRWFSSRKEGVVGYVVKRRRRITAGGPVCPFEDLGDLVAEFEEDAAAAGTQRVCWFCAVPELAALYLRSPGRSAILIGAQPVWDPASWIVKVPEHASLRRQLNRARNKGVRIVEWPPDKAREHPELERCLREWLASRPFPPLHFLVEPNTLGTLYDRRVFVAEREGRVIAFVIASPIPERNGWLIEQIIRGEQAPNGTAELTVHHTVSALADEGYSFVTLGLAPLSRRAGIPSSNPPIIRFLFGWLRFYGRRFYNFDGLDFFKAKFRPDAWEPVYALSNEPRFSIATLYATAAAFSRRSPIAALAAGIAKAIRHEIGWLSKRLRSPSRR